MKQLALKELLDHKYREYSIRTFIDEDPIQIPHLFEKKEDIEISAFLTATIAWGNRKSIIRSAREMMELLDLDPYDFVMNAHERELSNLRKYVYRTFQKDDLYFFVMALRNIYEKHSGMEAVFTNAFSKKASVKDSLIEFRRIFLETPHKQRSEKHVANVLKDSAAKRLNLFLMWMVRKDKSGIHFGLWKGIPKSSLMIPLDVHVGNVARKLGLLERKQNDWQAVVELTSILSGFDPDDPVKYDFSLFGMGLNKDC